MNNIIIIMFNAYLLSLYNDDVPIFRLKWGQFIGNIYYGDCINTKAVGNVCVCVCVWKEKASFIMN